MYTIGRKNHLGIVWVLQDSRPLFSFDKLIKTNNEYLFFNPTSKLHGKRFRFDSTEQVEKFALTFANILK